MELEFQLLLSPGRLSLTRELFTLIVLDLELESSHHQAMLNIVSLFALGI